MSKQLILMRHGDASRAGGLTTCGEKQVDNVALQLVTNKVIPDQIVHSPAKHAVQTAQRVKDIFNSAGFDIPMKLATWLYHTAVVKDIRSIDPEANVVLAVSHAPNIKDLTHSFSNVSSIPQNAETRVISADIPDWSSFTQGQETMAFCVK